MDGNELRKRDTEANRGAEVASVANAFGQKLRFLRTGCRVSIRRTAALAGFAPSYLSRIERGQVPPPTARRIVRIASVLQTDPNDLIELAAKMPEDVSRAITRRPRLMAQLIRNADCYSDDQLERLCRVLRRQNPPH